MHRVEKSDYCKFCTGRFRIQVKSNHIIIIMYALLMKFINSNSKCTIAGGEINISTVVWEDLGCRGIICYAVINIHPVLYSYV